MENVSRSNCPVCLGDIHTSRYPCHIPDCGHLLHKTCFDQLVSCVKLVLLLEGKSYQHFYHHYFNFKLSISIAFRLIMNSLHLNTNSRFFFAFSLFSLYPILRQFAAGIRSLCVSNLSNIDDRYDKIVGISRYTGTKSTRSKVT